MNRPPSAPQRPGDRPHSRCDYCGLPCPPSPVTADRDGRGHEYCSPSCRDAAAREDSENAVFHEFKRFRPRVPVLERQLPAGLPRNSLTLVSSVPGTRGDALLIELAWYTLQRGGSAVVVAYREPPISVLEQFLSLEWNVLPYLDSGQLRIVDCFTYRVEDTGRMVDRLDPWSRHLHRAAADATEPVRDPSALGSVRNALDDCIESGTVRESGIVVFDSLTELGALVQPVHAYDFVKDLRADVAKGRFVPVFAHATYRDGDEFPHDLPHVMDGIVELRFDDAADRSRTRLRVRKMRGVPTSSRWTTYEYDGDRGLVAVAPPPEGAVPGAGPAEPARNRSKRERNTGRTRRTVGSEQ